MEIMVDVLPQQFEAPQKKRSASFYVFAGIFEFLFVVILLAAIFGMMLFLGIIHLPSTFPNIPGLPILQSTKPTQSTIVSNVAQTLIADFIHTTSNPSYEPPGDFHITTQGTIVIGNWIAKSDTMNVTVEFDNGFTTPQAYILRTTLLMPQELTATTAAALATQYFSHVPQVSLWTCETSPRAKICRVHTTDSRGKWSYGIFHLQSVQNNQQVTLYACQIPLKSSSYASLNDCAEF